MLDSNQRHSESKSDVPPTELIPYNHELNKFFNLLQSLNFITHGSSLTTLSVSLLFQSTHCKFDKELMQPGTASDCTSEGEGFEPSGLSSTSLANLHNRPLWQPSMEARTPLLSLKNFSTRHNSGLRSWTPNEVMHVPHYPTCWIPGIKRWRRRKLHPRPSQSTFNHLHRCFICFLLIMKLAKEQTSVFTIAFHNSFGD